MKLETKSSESPGVSLPLSGNNPVVQRLKALGKPVTRENYLALAYPEGAPVPLPAEDEAILDEALES